MDAELIQLCQEMTVEEDEPDECPTCGGTGICEEDGLPCEDCDGTGIEL